MSERSPDSGSEPEEDDPNDPSHPDFDLSDAGGDWYHYEVASKPWFTRRWVLLLIGALVIVSLIIAILPR